MSLTRRDTIKSILSAAAISAVPAVAKAAIDAKPLTKAESIYAKIKELISKCEKERGLPFDPQRDSVIICLPASFDLSDLNETSKCFRMEYPSWRWGGFKVFKSADCLTVKISRMVDADEGSSLYEIDPAYSVEAILFLQDGQIVTCKY